MKVTRSENFTPITIVLETEAEAREMWARLNVSVLDVKRANKDFGITDDDLRHDFWVEFNEIFNIEEVND